MIIVELLGGLGNQLFQYAAGRRLAHVHNTSLKLDIHRLQTPVIGQTVRHYSLSPFRIVEDFAQDEEIVKLKRTGLTRKWIRLIDKLNLPIRFSHVIERRLDFDPAILKLKDHRYLEGYWQSPLYFEDVADVLRAEFTLKVPPAIENEVLLNQIQSSNSVSLHVRRGDYESNPHTREIHGLLPLDYYEAAIQYIKTKIASPHFFIFSDDPGWVQNHFNISEASTLVTNNQAKDFEDLRLMSSCQHHIMANSSFSWWGAWLNPDPMKIVIAPVKWSNTQEMNYAARFPKTWHRL